MDNSRPKIMLVDDNLATLNQGKSLLQALYRVYTVQSAALLFENLELGLPDLILLDVEMPEMDGFETIKKLKSTPRYKNIPVIFLTSKSDEESERKGFRLGAVDYVTKPFSGPLLQKRISNQILYSRVQSAIDDYSNSIETMMDEVSKANRRTKVLLDKTPLCAWLWNSEHKMIDCNEAAVSLFGFQDKQECMDRYPELYPLLQSDGENSQDKADASIEQAIKDGYYKFVFEYKMLDGTDMPAEVVLVRIDYDDDYTIAWYARDLREQKALVEEIKRSEIAEERNKTKTHFLATISHEIRTPMNSIMGFAELALDSPENSMTPPIKDYLTKIKNSTKWLLLIINDILDISKIESGKMELEHAPFGLHETVMRCQSVILPSATEKGLDLIIDSDSLDGKSLIGDPVRLYQALINLLSNAVKFTDNGVVELTSRVHDVNDAKTTVHFEIRDTGIGIDPEQIEKIFDPFIQADPSITRNYGGTGLGLAITKSIVEMMGGTLEVESTPGSGSIFRFKIEFDTVDALEDMAGRADFAPLQKPHFDSLVLVCEDNPMNQQVISEHLGNVGIQAEVADNGKIGLEMVRSRMESGKAPYDLILMDMFMPVMDGIEAATKIGALKSGSPIVAMTANIMASELSNYRRHGMPDCIGKPFTSQELWQILTKYLTPLGHSRKNENELDNEELQHKLRVSFYKNNQDTFILLAEAIYAQDLKLAHRLAHTLKGNAGLIGKPQLQEQAAAIELMLKEGALEIPVESMKRLDETLSAVLDELKSEMAESDTNDGSEQLDQNQALVLLNKLEPMLTNINPECEILVDEVRRIPGAANLARHIEDFDFSSALSALIMLRDNLKKYG